ncbi:MAG: hypothetical protein WC003_03315 [Terrimicrobiaceae bacterium]
MNCESTLTALKELGIDASSEDGAGGTTEEQFQEKIAFLRGFA